MLVTLNSPTFVSAPLKNYFSESLEIILSVTVIGCMVGKLVGNVACCIDVIYGDCYNSWLDTSCGYP